MKKILIYIGAIGILTGCSFVKDADIKKGEEIPVSSFLQEKNGAAVSSGKTLAETGTIVLGGSESSGSTVPKETREVTTPEKQLIPMNPTKTVVNTMSSGSETEDELLRSTSDKDVENLINSLFESAQ